MCSLTISRIILLSLGTQIYNRSVDKFMQPSYLLLVIIVDTLASFQNERYFTLSQQTAERRGPGMYWRVEI